MGGDGVELMTIINPGYKMDVSTAVQGHNERDNAPRQEAGPAFYLRFALIKGKIYSLREVWVLFVVRISTNAYL